MRSLVDLIQGRAGKANLLTPALQRAVQSKLEEALTFVGRSVEASLG